MAHAPEVMAFYAPTVNSYKRYQSGSWAPTRLAWCHDNRTAGFRVVGSGASLRIECRIPGADCNPYLVYAAALASGSLPPPIYYKERHEYTVVMELPDNITEVIGDEQFAIAHIGQCHGH